MFVLGTAGHIDHGKSILVRALTGMDPDRLREEKERGMTIDLGFAWLKLPGGQEVGIVDVPGHEHFIKNMLAGVGSIDLALLIVAANEGVMPQTREHLAILDLLGIRRGIVVVTKKDLVDEEWLDLVKLEVEELVSPTGLSGAPIIAVSAVTGEGLTGLVSVIDQLLSFAQPRKDIGRPRLPVDRVFTIAGAGTIVTGTLIDGTLSVGQEVEVVPAGMKSRLRGLQTHKARIDVAIPGSRVAANLQGVSTSQLGRGDVLTTPGWLRPTTVLDVKLRMLSYIRRPLLHNATVSFYTGSTETAARVRLMERKELQPGEISWAQLSLGNPVAVVGGDHFIIRSSEETLGGGHVVDPHARRHRRFRPALIQRLEVKDEGTVEEMIMALLEEKQPLELTTLLSQYNLPAAEAEMAMGTLVQGDKVVEMGQGEFRLLMTRPGWERLVADASAMVYDYHRRFPARRGGMPKGELGNKLKLPAHSAVWERLFEEGILIKEGAAVRLPSHQVRLTQAQQLGIDAFLLSLSQNTYILPAECLLEPDLLNLLIERHQVVKISDGIIISASTYEEMKEKVVGYAKAHGKITLAEARDMFNTSRKYAKALLEYMDEQGITRRVGDERVLR